MEMFLGKKLRDKVSGFTGIASVKTNFLTGTVQYTLVPPVDKKGDVREMSFDVYQLEYVDEGVDTIEAPTDTGIKLGEEVKDIVTSMEGIAIQECIFLNGCVYYTVTTKDEKDPKDLFIEYRRLTRTGAGVSEQITARTAVTKVKTGGPAYKVPMRG
jgi:predicted metalloprotease with PDZ domain